MLKNKNKQEEEQEDQAAPEEQEQILLFEAPENPDEPKLRLISLYGEVDEDRAAEITYGLRVLKETCSDRSAPELPEGEEGPQDEPQEDEEKPQEDKEKPQEDKEPIEFIISTYGGSAVEMFAIYDTMRMVKDECEIHTLGLGKVMSAGVLLLAAGTKGKRKIAKNCRVMMHSVIGGSAGAIHNLENEMEEIRFTQKQHIECLLEETTMTRAYLKRLLNKRVNVYLTAEEAVELGIADEIV